MISSSWGWTIQAVRICPSSDLFEGTIPTKREFGQRQNLGTSTDYVLAKAKGIRSFGDLGVWGSCHRDHLRAIVAQCILQFGFSTCALVSCPQEL